MKTGVVMKTGVAVGTGVAERTGVEIRTRAAEKTWVVKWSWVVRKTWVAASTGAGTKAWVAANAWAVLVVIGKAIAEAEYCSAVRIASGVVQGVLYHALLVLPLLLEKYRVLLVAVAEGRGVRE